MPRTRLATTTILRPSREERDWLSSREVATELNVSYDMVVRYCHTGKLQCKPRFPDTYARYRILKTSVEAYKVQVTQVRTHG